MGSMTFTLTLGGMKKILPSNDEVPINGCFEERVPSHSNQIA